MNDTKIERTRRLSLKLRFFKMASQLPHLLACARGLTRTAHQIIWALISRTFAARIFDKDAPGKMRGQAYARLTCADLARLTGLDRGGVTATLKDLWVRQIIRKDPMGAIGLSPYFEDWQGCWEPGDLARLGALFSTFNVDAAHGAASYDKAHMRAASYDNAHGDVDAAHGDVDAAHGDVDAALQGSNARAGELGELGELGEVDPPLPSNSRNGQTTPPTPTTQEDPDAWWLPDPDTPPARIETYRPDKATTDEALAASLLVPEVAEARARAHKVSDANRKPARPL